MSTILLPFPDFDPGAYELDPSNTYACGAGQIDSGVCGTMYRMALDWSVIRYDPVHVTADKSLKTVPESTYVYPESGSELHVMVFGRYHYRYSTDQPISELLLCLLDDGTEYALIEGMNDNGGVFRSWSEAAKAFAERGKTELAEYRFRIGND